MPQLNRQPLASQQKPMDDIERKIVEMLLSGDNPVLHILRQQMAVAAIASREYSGAGFFTNFKVPLNAEKVERPINFELSDVYATVSGLQHEAGFILFVRAGIIDFLECFIVDDSWPEQPQLIEAFYVGHSEPNNSMLTRTDTRDMQNLVKVLAA